MASTPKIDPFKKLKSSIKQSVSESAPKTQKGEQALFKAADKDKNGVWSREEMAGAVAELYGMSQEEVIQKKEFNDYFDEMKNTFNDENSPDGITLKDVEVSSVNSQLCEFFGVDEIDQINERDHLLYYQAVKTYINDVNSGNAYAIDNLYSSIESLLNEEEQLTQYAEAYPEFEEYMLSSYRNYNDSYDISLAEMYRSGRLGFVNGNNSIVEDVFEIFQYREAEKLEYETLIRHCNEKGIEIPQDIMIGYASFENQAEYFAGGPHVCFEQCLDGLADRKDDFIDSLGIELYSEVDENGFVTNTTMIIENEDGTTSTIICEYSIGENNERYISSKTETITNGEETTEELTTKYQQDGSFVTTNSAGEVVNDNITTGVTTVASYSNKTNESEDDEQDNLGESELITQLGNSDYIGDFYNYINAYTGGDEEMSRILFNSIFENSDVMGVLNGQEVYIDENNIITINGEQVSEYAKNPLADKNDLLVNAIFEYRNGKYVIDDGILEKASEASAKYDTDGKITSYKQYYVNDNGEIGQVEVSYSYDGAGNIKQQTSVIYDASGNITCTDVTTFEESDNGVIATRTRSNAQGYNEVITEPIEDFQVRTRNEAIARKYTDRIDLTDEELGYILTIDYLTNSNSQNKDTLLGQDYDEGIFSQGYNWIKESTGWGTARSEITSVIDQTSRNNQALIDAINTPGANFQEIYQSIYGVDYDQNKIDELRMQEAAIQLYSSSQSEITGISTMLDEFYYSDKFNEDEEKRKIAIVSVIEYAYPKPSNMSDEEYSLFINEKYSQYIQEKELMAEFSTVLVENEYVLDYSSYGSYESYNYYLEEQRRSLEYQYLNEELTDEEYEQKINELYENTSRQDYSVEKMAEALQHTGIEQRFIETYGEEEGLSKYKEYLVSVYNNCSRTMSADKIEQIISSSTTNCIQDDLMTNLNDNMLEFGFNPTTLVEDYNANCTLAFGENYNQIGEILEDYISSQQGFADTITQVAQGIGTVCIIGGCIVASYASGGMLAPILFKAGQVITLASIFGKDAYDFIEEATSKNCSEEELNAIVKDTIQDAALYYSGRMIGKCSNWLHGVAEKSWGLGKVGGYAVEIAADTALSLTADYAITGSIDLRGEGFSQALALWTGIATEKFQLRQETVRQAQTEAYNDYIRTGNAEAAVEKLIAAGFSQKRATQFVESMPTKIDSGVPNLTVTRKGTDNNQTFELEMTVDGKPHQLEFVDSMDVDGQKLSVYYDEQAGISYTIDANGRVKYSNFLIEADGKVLEIETQYNEQNNTSKNYIVKDDGTTIEIIPDGNGKNYKAYDSQTDTLYRLDENKQLIGTESPKQYLLNNGFTEVELADIRMDDIDATKAAEIRKAGYSPELALKYANQSVDLAKASKIQDAGYSPELALKYSNYAIDIEVANSLKVANYEPELALKYSSQNVDLTRAAEIREAGFTDEIALRYSSLGIETNLPPTTSRRGEEITLFSAGGVTQEQLDSILKVAGENPEFKALSPEMQTEMLLQIYDEAGKLSLSRTPTQIDEVIAAFSSPQYIQSLVDNYKAGNLEQISFGDKGNLFDWYSPGIVDLFNQGILKNATYQNAKGEKFTVAVLNDTPETRELLASLGLDYNECVKLSNDALTNKLAEAMNDEGGIPYFVKQGYLQEHVYDSGRGYNAYFYTLTPEGLEQLRAMGYTDEQIALNQYKYDSTLLNPISGSDDLTTAFSRAQGKIETMGLTPGEVEVAFELSKALERATGQLLPDDMELYRITTGNYEPSHTILPNGMTLDVALNEVANGTMTLTDLNKLFSQGNVTYTSDRPISTSLSPDYLRANWMGDNPCKQNVTSDSRFMWAFDTSNTNGVPTEPIACRAASQFEITLQPNQAASITAVEWSTTYNCWVIHASISN